MALKSNLFRGDSKLESAATSHAAHIKQGASGPHVRKIQEALIAIDKAAIKADSAFGPKTAAAVAAFKQARGIVNTQGKIDSVVGIGTIGALDTEVAQAETGKAVGPGGVRKSIVFENPAKAKVVHRLVYFSGVADDKGLGGVPLVGAHGQDVMTDMENFRTVSPNEKVVFGFGGSIVNPKGGPALALAALTASQNPNSKIIIYGFSAGAMNAMELCRMLKQVDLSVTLLVTVDAAAKGGNVDRSIPDNVQLNRNYFQTTKSLNNSVGAPNIGRNVQNINCDNRSFSPFLPKSSHHGEMQAITRGDVRNDMSTALNK